MKLNKKFVIGISAFLVVLILFSIGFLVYGLSPVENSDEEVLFIIEPGTPTVSIIKNLKDSGLIKNEFAAKVYVKISNYSLMAGSYKFTKNLSAVEILEMISDGNVTDDSISITFVEGKRLSLFVKQISAEFPYSEEEIIAKINDKEYLNQLIEKYWFLTTEILNDNIYFALEGYLYPDTYKFKESSTIEEIIEKILDTTNVRLSTYKEKIESSEYTVHEILSMATIIELEANTSDDRAGVSQVIYKRISLNMSLGMDVTAYYAVKKQMGDVLTVTDLNTVNAYNTREGANLNGYMSGKLPVGPICNPSIDSINAVFNPTDADYLYFYADIRTGKVRFASTYADFLQIIREVG